MNPDKSSLFLQLVAIADYRWNNSLFMQNSSAFKKYHSGGKFVRAATQHGRPGEPGKVREFYV